MKIAPADSARFLKNPHASCRGILVYGPDGGLVRERVNMLTALAVPSGDGFNITDIQEEKLLADPALLADELSAMSLLGGKRVVRIRAHSEKLAGIIEEAVAHTQEGNMLIVSAEELTPRSALRTAFEKSPLLAALACYKEDSRAREATIRTALSEQGIQCDGDVLRYLTEHLGNDRGVTLSELEKILVYKGDDTHLTLEEASALVGYNDDLSSDDVCQAVAGGDVAAADNALSRLLAEGAQPIMLLRSVTRYLQKLYSLRAMMEAGQTAEQAIQALRPPVFFREVPLLKKYLARWSSASLVKALGLLLETERDIKSAGAVMPELLTSRALLTLAQLRNP